MKRSGIPTAFSHPVWNRVVWVRFQPTAICLPVSQCDIITHEPPYSGLWVWPLALTFFKNTIITGAGRQMTFHFKHLPLQPWCRRYIIYRIRQPASGFESGVVKSLVGSFVLMSWSSSQTSTFPWCSFSSSGFPDHPDPSTFPSWICSLVAWASSIFSPTKKLKI